jgi:protein-disulfide isomerase
MKALIFLFLFAAQLLALAQEPAPAQYSPKLVRTHTRPAQTPRPPPPVHVEVVLYSDFQCPFCALFARAFRELQAKGVEGVVTSVRFKHFPLDALHPAAQLAHMAALAAGEQGKFWEMHDLLFADQSSLTRERAVHLATKLRLDAARFERDLDSNRLRQVIADNRDAGARLGVQGTPTFFVNDKGYSGARSFEQLKQIINVEVARVVALAEVSDQMLSRGPAEAPVTVELFADLQSPVTRLAVTVIDEATRKYPSQVRIQFRNFPLSFHPQAPLAHEAAMAAASQGRFWELLSFILDHQGSLREQDLIAQAGRLGLNQAKFAESLGQHRFAPRVEADLEAGRRRGLRGSPVLFINGRRIDGVPRLEKIVESIESELATAHVSKGASRP